MSVSDLNESGWRPADIRKVGPVRVEPSSRKTEMEGAGGLTGTRQPHRSAPAKPQRPKERIGQSKEVS